MKKHHSNTINIVVQLNNVDFNRLKFLVEFKSFHSKTFKSTTIQFAFQKIDFISFNSDVILNKIRKKVVVVVVVVASSSSLDRLRNFTSSMMNNSSSFTSIRVYELIEQEERIATRLKNDEIITFKRLQCYFKAFVSSFDLLNLIQRDLKASQTVVIRKRTRQKFVNIVAQKESVVIIDEVRHNYIRKSQQELKRVKIHERRLEAIRQKNILLHDKTIAKRFDLVDKKVIE